MLQPLVAPHRQRNKKCTIVKQGIQAMRMRQYDKALAYCKEHQCGAKKCLNDNKENWPLVSKTSLIRRLQGKVKDGALNVDKAILTGAERQRLAEVFTSAAKSGHGYRPKDRSQAVLDTLRWRKTCNESGAGGRRYVKLSRAATKALRTGKVSKTFWIGFFAEFHEILDIGTEV
jgi:hypothetical protein